MLRRSSGRPPFHLRWFIQKRLIFLTTAFLLFSVSTTLSQDVPTTKDQRTARPLQMLVLGDSILWGQGLKDRNKTWHHVKVWLEKNTGRRVIERIEAHSGAVIERTLPSDNLTSTNREVNSGLPSINEEIDNALRFYSDPSQVDLVLVSGCGNDVGVQNLLDATSINEVDDMTAAKCGKPVENLLRRIATAFPSAQVIVTGYYPFFSEQSRNDFVTKGLARRFFKTQLNGGRKISSKEVFARLNINSKQWYEASNKNLAEAAWKNKRRRTS